MKKTSNNISFFVQDSMFWNLKNKSKDEPIQKEKIIELSPDNQPSENQTLRNSNTKKLNENINENELEKKHPNENIIADLR